MSKLHAETALASLLEGGLKAESIDEVHDLLKLMGVVLGQLALLEIVIDRDADEKARVSAARILTSIKEDPEHIAERLRRSPFAALTVEQLEAIIVRVKRGEPLSLSDLKEPPNATASPNDE